MGVAARACFLAANRGEPLFAMPIVDAVEYHRWALQLLSGRGLLPSLPFHGPTYPLFLSAIYWIWGPNPWAVYAAQAVLGGLVCALCAAMARQASGSEWAALGAGAAAAWAWPMVYPSGYLLPYALDMTLVAGTMFLLCSKDGNPRRAAWAGVCMGLACHSRPQLFVSAALLSAALPWVRRRWDWKECAAFVVPIVAITLSWSAFVWRRTGVPVLVESRNSGFSIYYGNHPGAGGQAVLFPGYDYHRILYETQRRGAYRAQDQDAYYYGAVWNWVRSDPRGFARLCARKLALSVSAVEIPTGEAEPWTAAGTFAGWRLCGFGALFAFGLTGLVVGAWRGSPALRLQLTLFASGVLYLILAGVASRYRAPLLPGLAVGAGCLVPVLQDCHRRKRWAAEGALLAGVLCCLIVSGAAGALVETDPPRDAAIARALSALAWDRDGAYLARSQAEIELRLAERRYDLDLELYLGMLRVRRGDWASAEPIFTDLSSRLGRNLPYMYSYVAAIRAARGNFTGAREASLQAYAADGRSLEDCLSSVLFGLMASPPMDRPDSAYRCPLAPAQHHPSYPPVEVLAGALAARRIPDPQMSRALRPIEAWALTRLLK